MCDLDCLSLLRDWCALSLLSHSLVESTKAFREAEFKLYFCAVAAPSAPPRFLCVLAAVTVPMCVVLRDLGAMMRGNNGSGVIDNGHFALFKLFDYGEPL